MSDAPMTEGGVATDASDTTLPTFIVIGAAKAGTTSVAGYLSQHPDVFVTVPKEPRHFTGRGDYADIADYRALFAGADGFAARGEASTQYTRQSSFPGVPARIKAAVPDVRLVYLIRDPMDRVRSHYLMWLRNGTTEGSFEEFVTRSDWQADISCYARQLEAYLEHFPLEQIHIAHLEDLERDPRTVLRGIATHIGVDPSFFDGQVDLKRKNEAPAGPARRYPKIPAPIRRSAALLPKGLRHSLKTRLPDVEVESDELQLTPETEAALTELFARDQARLRELLADRPAESADAPRQP